MIADNSGGFANNTPASRRYQASMVAITSLVIAFLATDRLATGYIGPFLTGGLGLSATQLGLLYSAQALTVAISGIVIGHISDRTGKRKRLLVPLLLFCAAAAATTLLADGYLQLMAVRLVLGAALGGLTPIVQSIVSVQSPPSRLGLHIGVQTLLMFLISQMAGPLITTHLAATYGWQATYAASALPFLVLAVLVALLMRENPPPPDSGPHELGAHPVANLPSKRFNPTIVLCVAISVAYMSWLVIHATFLALYLVEVRGATPTGAGSIMSVLGIAGAIGGMVLPLVSGRLGKRETLLGAMLLSTIVPLAALFWTGSLVGLQVLLFIGWLSVGALPIYAVLLPGSAVSPLRLGATIALITGAGEVFGGIAGPMIAGQLADRLGIIAPFVFTLAMSITGVILAAGMFKLAMPAKANP
jgi:ACS family hexuronate transporter-like MFS transporter